MIDLVRKITLSRNEWVEEGRIHATISSKRAKISVGNGKSKEKRVGGYEQNLQSEKETAKSVGDGKREILMGVSTSVVAGIPKQLGAKMSAERKFNRRNLTKDVPCRGTDKT